LEATPLDQYDLIIDALHSIRHMRARHGSGAEAVPRLIEIADTLRGRAEHLPPMPNTTPPQRANDIALLIAETLARMVRK
jgi:hypothetical protein